MITRSITEEITRQLLLYPAVVITGPRQVGKSTIVHTFVESHGFNYVSLDDIDQRQSAITDPKYFIASHKLPLIIDEVQYAPRLLEVIEATINERRLSDLPHNGLFILTGSQTFELMKDVTQSLAGRAAIIRMLGLSEKEIKSTVSTPISSPAEVSGRIFRGHFPELYNNPRLDSPTFFRNYVATYLDRDISSLSNIKDKTKFHNFMNVLASLTGQELVYDTLAKAIGIDISTVKAWISVLETSGLVYLVHPYNQFSVIKRVVKRPKLYFADTGLACFLAKIPDSENLRASIYWGRFFETFVMNEIVKSFINIGKDFPGYYFRDTNGHEIDLILLDEGKIHLWEIKAGISYSLSDIKAFNQFKDMRNELGDSGIICMTSKGYPLGDGFQAISFKTIQ